MMSMQLIGLLGLAAVAACWGLAIVLFRIGGPSSDARKLAILLVIEGIVLVTAGFPQYATGLPVNYWREFDLANPLINQIAGLIHHLADAGMIALYPAFLAFTLRTKFTRAFTNRLVRLGLAVVAVAFALTVSFAGSRVITTAFYLTVTLVFIYAFVASIHAWRTAESGLAKTRAGIFATAFGLRDLLWGLSYAIAAWAMWVLQDRYELSDIRLLGKLVYALGTLLAVPLIAYGVLRAHLFDIDLKVRWTIKQSTLAALVVSCVFLISEGADRLLSAELGGGVGLLAAAIVVFFLAPLQRFADRIASSAMPNTENTPEYAMFRKMQVYEEALREASEEGGISDKERALLVRLRDSLGISQSDADAIEAELGSTAA